MKFRLPEVGALDFNDCCPWCGLLIEDLHEYVGVGECPGCSAEFECEAEASYTLTLRKPGDADQAKKIEEYEPL